MSDTVEQELQRGAFVNVLGTIGKIAGPSFLIVVTRLYGPDVFGIFITAAAFVETGLAFLTAGFKDGALMSVARHADHEDEKDRLYHLLSNTLGWSLLFATLLILLAFTLGPWLLPMLYEEYGARLLSMVQWMIVVLPVLAFDRIVIAATQGLKIMKYDAITNGGLRPVLLLASASAFWLWMPTTTGLAAAYVVTQLVLGLVAVWIFSREMAWAPLFDAFRNLKIDREMLEFAIPQNLNMTLERFITNIDIIMLGMFGVSASTTGFYGAGSMVVRELLNIKQVFSNAFVPHVVRLNRAGKHARLSEIFSKTSRWVATLAVPALLAVALLRSDILRLVSPEFSGAEALFMLALLPIPYMQCSFSLAGNIVVMTGHSRLNLLNSTTTAITNTLLNVWLIPLMGPLGAALASAAATALKTGMELVEAWYVAHARLVLRLIYRPHLAGLLTGGALLVALSAAPVLNTSFLYRLGALAAALLLYGGILIALNGRLPQMPLPLRSTSETGS
jgi:O-antigen/teichoic acid export membrane protein